MGGAAAGSNSSQSRQQEYQTQVTQVFSGPIVQLSEPLYFHWLTSERGATARGSLGVPRSVPSSSIPGLTCLTQS